MAKSRALSLLICLLAISVVSSARAQTSSQDFGTGTGANTTQTGSTSLIPNPTGSGTTYARGGATAPNAPIVLANTGNPLSTVNSYVRAVASTSTSVAKMTPAAGYTASTEFYTKFTALLGDSSAGTTASSGTWTFFQGAGANYTDNNDVASAQSFAAIRFTFAAAGAANLSYRSGSSFVTTSLGQTAFSQGTVYTIEIVGNNKASGTINYTYSGAAQSVAVQKFDLYINGTLVGNDLTPSAFTAGATINAATFTGISSSGNAANLFVDDVIIYNAVPASIGLATEPTTQASSIVFSNVQSTQMDVSFTAGNGANRLVIARSGSAPSGGPVDGTSYTADASFTGSGSSLGGGKVVYAGSGSSFTLTGLSASTTYHLQVFEYNGSGSAVNYLTSTASGNPNSQATQAPAFSTASDIIRAAAFTEPSDIAYATYQATDITSGNSIEVARFTIRDGGASADADTEATTLDAISFTVANSTGLRRVALYDGSTEIAELAAGATLTYSGISGLVAADGGTKDISVRATFNATVTDNQQFSFTVSSATANAGGSTFAAANAGGAVSSTTGDRNRIEVTASKLVFTSVPASANIDTDFTASVAARDANENLDLDSTASVTITKASGSGTLSGGSAQNLVAGVKSFTTLQCDTAGSITLSASDSPDTLTDATSSSITMVDELVAGDVTIVGYRTDTDDGFSFVTWKNLEAGQVLYFTDSGFFSDGTMRSSEDIMSWTAPVGGVAAGTVVKITCLAGTAVADVGTCTGSLSGLTSSGEQIFIGRGAQFPNGSDTTMPGETYTGTLLYGFSTEGAWVASATGTGNSALPAALSDTYANLALSASGGDNGQYTGSRVSEVSYAAYKALIHNAANWTREDAGTTSLDSTDFVLNIPASEPTTQASSVIFSSVQPYQMTVSWTSGNGANRVVICREGSAPSSGPVDGTTYTAVADFSGGGSALGGGKVVYDGSGNSFTLTGLNASTTYHLQVYEYNGTGLTVNYLTSSASGNPASQLTLDPPNSSASDIVRASGFTEPSNIAYANYQATDITDANSIELARFTIRDGGATTDGDALPTVLETIDFSVANGTRLRRVAIYDGATEIAEVAGGATVSFSGLTGLTAADGGTKNFSIRATFTSTVTDNQQIQFTVTGATVTAGNSEFATADAGGAASDTTGDANRIEVTATKLVFASVPSSVTIAQNFTAVVQARDANENVDLDDTTSVTIIKGSGTGTLTGGGAQNLSSGSQTWASLQMDETGTFTLQASGGSLSAAVSGTISAYPGPTTLVAGDIVIIGYNSGTSPDDLVILVTRDLGPGTTFFVNDNEVGTAGGSTFVDLGEMEASFTVKAGQVIPAGTVIVLPWNAAAVSTATYDWSSTAGAGIGNNNDELYIYTAANISSTTAGSFIFGVRIGSATGQRPAGLVQGSTWLILPPSGSANASRYKLTGATYTATTNAILAAIGDVANNWETAASYSMSDTDWTFTFLTPASQPTVQASEIVLSNVQQTQMDVSWTSGNGANRLVICRAASAPSSGPVDATAYSADANFSGSGSSLGGGKVVYIGSDSSFTVTGLNPSTAYYLQVYEFNGSDSTVNYLTSTAIDNPNSISTLAADFSAISDIVRATGFTEPENIAYASYQGADLEYASSIEVARFTIRDGGVSLDSDTSSTTLEDISFTVANSSSLNRLAIYDGATEIAEVAAGASVTFSGLTGLVAADGGTKDFSLRATFKASVTDNQQFSFTVSSATAFVNGSTFAAANAGAAASSTTGDRNRIEVTATKLVFTSVPANAGVAATFSATVQARDDNNNVDLDSAVSVTITKASGSGTLSGGAAQTLSSGSQTWASLAVDTAGTVTLQASGGSLTAATSSSITIANSLNAGDVSFVAFNADVADEFAIVFWKDVDSGTVLYFTDNEWTGSALNTGEGSFSWNSGGSMIASGTVVRFSNLLSGSRAASVGTISGFSGFDLGGSGEGILCFRGTSATSPSAFLAAIGNDTVANSFGSLTGTGLTDGDTAIRLTSGVDIGQYKGARSGYLATGYRALLNVMSNWDLQDGTGDQSIDGTVPDIPFSTTAFTFSSLATEPTTQASGINFSGITSSQMNVGWTSGNGANRLVVARAGSAPSGNPVDGTSYTADANYSGTGSSLGGGVVVYIGSGSSFTLSGLDPSTTYHLRVYEFNGTGGTVNYLTSTAAGNPNSQATAASGLSAVSDIERASGFTEPSNIDYGSYQATDITSGNSIELARFTIRDGSGTMDVDSSDTTLTSLSLAVANGARLRRVAIYDGTTEIAEVAGGATVTFPSIAGLVAVDDGTKDFSIRATFNAVVTDNQQLQFTVSSVTADLGGSTFASIDAGGASSDITGDANRIEVTATKLVFTYAQSSVLVGQDFTASVVARDALNNQDLDNTASVTITKASGSGNLTGGDAQNLVEGSATWSALQYDGTGTFTIQAADGLLTAATSSSISSVNALAAGDLAIIGRINNGSPDSFSVLALATIPAGSVIYFTDNAWSNNAPASFRGAALDGDGNETLMRLTVNSAISAGTIFRTTDADARWTWTTSGSIPFGGAATFASLSLATGGDQIYAFQVANLNTNPLGSVYNHLFVLDDTGTFEDPDNSSGSAQGNIPPGLSAGADTALTFPFSSDNIIGLNMNLAGQQNFGTKEEWLDFIGNQANWTTSASDLPSGGISFGLSCPAGTPPRLANPGNKTFTVGSSFSFSFVANDPGCYGVTLSAAGLPFGANLSTAFQGTNTVGTITWNPNSGQEGTYPIQITATDSGASTSNLVFRIYARGVGEATNSAGVPAGQAGWSVDVTGHADNGTLTWETANGVSYDVYYSDSSLGAGMSWVKQGTVQASGSSASLSVPEDNKRFYSVVPKGESPNTNGIWGVIKPTIPTGYSMMSAPLDLDDLSLQGSFGSALADVLDGDHGGDADKIMIRESNGSWTTIYLDGDDNWSASATLAKGQGFYIYRSGAPVTPRFAGPVGNYNAYTRSISSGWNIIGPSQGKDMSFTQVTSMLQGTPAGGWEESTADMIVIDEGGGQFHRIMKYNGSPSWLSLRTFAAPSVTILPGQGVYYFKQNSSGVTGLGL